MENKDKQIHIWHDNSGSDNYDLFFDIESPNETPPSTIKLHCHEDEANYRERWQIELSSTTSVQQLVNTERDRAVAKETQIENKLDSCCQEVKGRLDTAEQHITQNQTTIQGLQTDVQNVHSEVATAQQAANTERDRAVARENQIEGELNNCCQEVKGRLDVVEGNVQHLQTDVTALGGRVTTNETNITQLQHDVQNAQNTANTANTTAQQASNTANSLQQDVQNAQNTANTANTKAQQASQNATNALNQIGNIPTDIQGLRASLSALENIVQGLQPLWDYINYHHDEWVHLNGGTETITLNLSTWVSSFPNPTQIKNLLKRWIIVNIDQVRSVKNPVPVTFDNLVYDENNLTLTLTFYSTSGCDVKVLMTVANA